MKEFKCLCSILSAAIVVLVAACSSSNKSFSSSSADTLLLSLNRYPCFGYCPYYEATLYQSGYMLINRKGYMENLGVYSAVASKNEISDLMDEAKRIKFETLSDSFYNPGIADYPVTVVAVKVNKTLKKVFDGTPDAPPDLKKFEEKLHLFFTDTTRIWHLAGKHGSND